ncbi:hypothetical protein SDRG_00676 [Saprolegnia diclina VS20]|uniref:Uncharacterized protein n=1 Tax=Saprolegnia diclina (strain VS20) TaxID=1156394 RepID=T0SFN4_SAPDV|nr:hypothetical protein SDRG_00676 [Saprolegnia diclina VS20]EQC41817.1 hypothetical protein SDRG_00676 [Saprolegnia diclina VS20]|eukprot:XP_008604386.1 hypothetical protein SDRG_00676 [Saprolegnia diclina VS20]
MDPNDGMEAQSGYEQRGVAAYMRQLDDNAKKTRGQPLLDKGDRQFLNQVIHGESDKFNPDEDVRLRSMATHYGVASDYVNRSI